MTSFIVIDSLNTGVLYQTCGKDVDLLEGILKEEDFTSPFSSRLGGTSISSPYTEPKRLVPSSHCITRVRPIRRHRFEDHKLDVPRP